MPVLPTFTRQWALQKVLGSPIQLTRLPSSLSTEEASRNEMTCPRTCREAGPGVDILPSSELLLHHTNPEFLHTGSN